LKTTSKNGWTNIGSQGDIVIDNSIGAGIISGINGDNKGTEELRLKTDGNIAAVDYSKTAIQAKNAVLEAAGGYLAGKIIRDAEGNFVDANLLKLSLTGTAGIVARGKDGVYIDFNGNAANLREISSLEGTVNLIAASFVNDFNIIVGAVIGGKNIILNATDGDIGTADDYLRINQFDGGTTDLKASGSIYFNGTNTSNINLNSITISDGNEYKFAVWGLIIDNINAGDGAAITVFGNNRTDASDIANYFIVNNIVSQTPNGSFTILDTKADYTSVYSQSIGSLYVRNSYVGVQANYNVNGVSTIIDAVSKDRNGADFHVWSLDGNYDLDMNRSGLILNNDSLRVLSAFNHNLLLNGYFDGADSAFENSLADVRHSINGADKIVRLLSVKPPMESNVLNTFTWYYRLLFQPMQNNDENRPIIQPIHDENDEEKYGNAEENTDSEQAENTLAVST
jgi:hypothetical protein